MSNIRRNRLLLLTLKDRRSVDARLDAGIASTLSISALCFLLSCAPSKTSSPTKSSSSLTTASTENTASTNTSESLGARSFAFNLETSKYILKFDMSGFGLTDANGDLTSNYVEVEGHFNRLIKEVDNFDLSKPEGLRDFGNHVGQQLKITDKHKVFVDIRSIHSHKLLFQGELNPVGDKLFEFKAKPVTKPE